MPLVTSKEMLAKAQKGGYAVGAFNAENMEMVKAIIQAAEELKAPVMIQTTPSTVKYGTVETYAATHATRTDAASTGKRATRRGAQRTDERRLRSHCRLRSQLGGRVQSGKRATKTGYG